MSGIFFCRASFLADDGTQSQEFVNALTAGFDISLSLGQFCIHLVQCELCNAFDGRIRLCNEVGIREEISFQWMDDLVTENGIRQEPVFIDQFFDIIFIVPLGQDLFFGEVSNFRKRSGALCEPVSFLQLKGCFR